MIAFIIVTHCGALSRGIVEEAHIMAPDVTVIPAGGTADGGIGTDISLISRAIEEAGSAIKAQNKNRPEGPVVEEDQNRDGIIILMDLGSAVMTTRLALEEFEDENIVLADCPIVEGAVAGTVLAQAGAGMEEILMELERAASLKKL